MRQSVRHFLHVVDHRQRLLIALGITFAVAIVAHASYSHEPPGGMSDFDQVWIAANALRHGTDPYAALRATGWPFPLYYPLTAAVIAMPLALFPVAWARVVFFSSGAGILAWTLGAAPHRRLAFLSGSFFDAFVLAQWSPFMTGSIGLPAFLAGAILSAKPTIGLALGFAYFLPFTRRTLWAIAGSATTLAISIGLRPSWPVEFLAAVRNAPHIISPITLLPLGPVLLVGLLRWRREEARLLIALALTPQTIVPYSTVPLFLVPRSRKESMVLVLLADLAYGIDYVLRVSPHAGSQSIASRVHISGQLMVGILYIPCLVMILRRPNEAAQKPLQTAPPRVASDSAPAPWHRL